MCWPQQDPDPEGMGFLKKSPKPEEAYKALKCGNIPLLKELLSKGCNPQGYADQFTGDVCLHLAANKGREEIVVLLLANKADVNVVNKLGQTPLHCASGYGFVETVQKLLAAGAKTNVADKEGQTPLDVAKAYGNSPEVVALLQQSSMC